MFTIEYLQKYVNAIIKPSSVDGVGFFAVRDIEIGEQIFKPWEEEDGLYSITQEELFTLPEELQKNIRGAFYDKTFTIDSNGDITSSKREYGKIFIPLKKGYHWVYLYPGMFINTGLINANVDTTSNINIKAIKKIKRGEELLANYGYEFKSIKKNII